MKHGVLIDCGLSTKQVLKRLAAVGLEKAPIDAVLITHEHSDHVGAARVLERALKRRSGRDIPFYMTPGTARNVNPHCRPQQLLPVTAGKAFRIENWIIEPSMVPHDTADPVAYTVQIGTSRVGVITDLGRPTRPIVQQLSTLDIAIVEFNHDVEMLMDSAYPWRVKQRIRGPQGHLSNDQSAALVAAGASSRLKHIILGHLSAENNAPERALQACEEALFRAGQNNVSIHLARQEEPLRPITNHGMTHRPTRSKTSRRGSEDSALQASLFPGM